MNLFRFGLSALAFALCVSTAAAQEASPPISLADREAAYVDAINKRTADIVIELKLSDSAKSNKVTDVILTQYRLLRNRDDAIDNTIKLMGADEATAAKIHADYYEAMTPPLHANFLTKLSKELTPDQIDIVKDKMTYGKVKVTYDAYCAIIPGLNDLDKAEIMANLKRARDEAIDGGNTAEKSRIFQKYKDRINEYLNNHGHDVAKAYREWDLKQQEAQAKVGDKSAPKTN